MATIRSNSDSSSSLAHPAEKTALLLLDFQGFTIGLCKGGDAATENAARLREWALAQKVLIIHSIVDVNGTVPPTTKGAARISDMVKGLRDNKEAISEHASLAFSGQDREYLSLKTPGIVSGMKADDCQNVLSQNGIRSIIICGLSTSGAVLRTAIPATDDGYAVTVIQDACADRTSEVHDFLVKDILPSRAHVIPTADFIEAWSNAS